METIASISPRETHRKPGLKWRIDAPIFHDRTALAPVTAPRALAREYRPPRAHPTRTHRARCDGDDCVENATRNAPEAGFDSRSRSERRELGRRNHLQRGRARAREYRTPRARAVHASRSRPLRRSHAGDPVSKSRLPFPVGPPGPFFRRSRSSFFFQSVPPSGQFFFPVGPPGPFFIFFQSVPPVLFFRRSLSSSGPFFSVRPSGPFFPVGPSLGSIFFTSRFFALSRVGRGDRGFVSLWWTGCKVLTEPQKLRNRGFGGVFRLRRNRVEIASS